MRTSVLPLLLLSLCASACGGAGHLSGGVYEDAQARYHVGEPAGGFRPLDVGGRTDLAWADESQGAVLEVDSRCEPALDIPLVALTNHLLVGFTEREDVEEQALVPLDGREALRTHVRAKLDGVPREMMMLVLKKDGCVHDFVLVAPPGAAFEATRPALDRVVAGFRTEPRGR
ncbi:MAG: hypothetical protein U0230_02220 [Polyangiales bacterium]